MTFVETLIIYSNSYSLFYWTPIPRKFSEDKIQITKKNVKNIFNIPCYQRDAN